MPPAPKQFPPQRGDTAEPVAGPIVVVGGANLDITAVSHHPLMAQDSHPGQVCYSPGGVARNVAENLARLGQTVHLISVVGPDTFGQTLLEQTALAGVRVGATLAVDGARTATYVSLQGPDGDMALAVNDMEIMQSLTPQRLQQQAALLAGASAWVLDCNTEPAAIDWLFAQSRPIPVKVDGVSVHKCIRIQQHLARMDTLKVNRLEAQALSGAAVHSVADACGAAQALCDRGVRLVLISLGAQGLVWCEAGAAARYQAGAEVPVVSTTGAGDALLAGVVDAQCRGLSSADAVLRGMACAEITLQAPRANASHLTPDLLSAHVARRAAKAPDS